jgi:hypothetical protein
MNWNRNDDAKRLERLLQASPAPPAVPPALHARIMDGVRNAAPLAPRRFARPELAAFLAVVVPAAGLLLVLNSAPSGGRASPQAVTTAGVPSFPTLHSLLTLVPDEYPSPDATLQREADALKNELTSAGSYILACAGVDG